MLSPKIYREFSEYLDYCSNKFLDWSLLAKEASTDCKTSKNGLQTSAITRLCSAMIYEFPKVLARLNFVVNEYFKGQNLKRSLNNTDTEADIELFAKNERLCIKIPLLHSRNIKTPFGVHFVMPYEKLLCDVIETNIDKIPDFVNKKFYVINVYDKRTKQYYMADPDNIDSKQVIDCISTYLGGDCAANTLYSAASVMSDEVPSGCYIFVIHDKDMFPFAQDTIITQIKEIIAPKPSENL